MSGNQPKFSLGNKGAQDGIAASVEKIKESLDGINVSVKGMIQGLRAILALREAAGSNKPPAENISPGQTAANMSPQRNSPS